MIEACSLSLEVIWYRETGRHAKYESQYEPPEYESQYEPQKLLKSV